MTKRVRRPAAEPPPQLIDRLCPCCGAHRSVVNGAWLKYRRQQAGIDQRTLAKQFDVSGPYLSDLERNRRDCPPMILNAYKQLPKGRAPS